MSGRLKYMEDVKYSLVYRVFQQKNRPRWLKILNRISLSGLIATPFIFFGSIFMFDNPDNLLRTFLFFLAINSYSVVIFLFSWLSYKIYPVNKWLGALSPLIPITGYLYVAIWILPGT
jgi:hypothetical protein